MISFDLVVLGNQQTGYILSFQAEDTTKQQILFFIEVLRLYDHEYNLNDGRFVNYSKPSLDNKIMLPIGRNFDNNFSYQLGSYEFDNYNHLFGSLVDWINDNCIGKWNIDMKYQKYGNKFEITFEKEVDAVLCKLIWS